MRPLCLVAIVAACASGCSADPPPRAPAELAADAAPPLADLRAGRFADATRDATAVLARDPRHAQVAAIRAISEYVTAADELAREVSGVVESADAIHAFDHEEGRAMWTRFLGQLEAVDRDLAVAERDPDFSLELCLACWTDHDWNHNGRIDDGDRLLFQIENDGSGQPLPAGDPRRTPTFRFDAGDIEWARAMIAFQHAGAELVLAYRWSELDKMFFSKRRDGDGQRIVIHLIDADRVQRARKDILAALDFSARERAAYLAETDDDREWVPNPRQKSHPMPLAVDEQLYSTWSEILGDVRHLLESDDGISLRDAAALLDKRAARIVPDAYMDFGRMLREPQDFVIDLTATEPTPANAERMTRALLGHGYVEKMHASPLVARARQTMDELDQGPDSFERKLHYLFWLN